jgi:hypothetical protein
LDDPGSASDVGVRSVYLSRQWEAYQAERIEQETQRRDPYRKLVVSLDAVEPQYAMAV